MLGGRITCSSSKFRTTFGLQMDRNQGGKAMSKCCIRIKHLNSNEGGMNTYKLILPCKCDVHGKE